MASIRILRLQKELAKLINKTICEKARDDRLSWVTITEVRLTNDMQHAKVFFSSLNSDEKTIEKAGHALAYASGFIKKEIGSAKIMRVIPELKFIYDETEEKARSIENILDKINKEREKEREDEEEV